MATSSAPESSSSAEAAKPSDSVIRAPRPPTASGPAKSGADDVADAADDGDDDDLDRGEAGEREVVDGDRPEGEERAAEAGDAGGEGEAVELGAVHAHAEGGGGPLVAAHGEEAQAGAAAPEVGHDQAARA